MRSAKTRLQKPAGGDAAAYALAAFLGFAGTTHFVNPSFYDPIVPHALPLSPRVWTYLSGAAELAVAATIANRRTRAFGGMLAAGLFVAVFPGNVQMAYDWRDRSAREQGLAYARLPLQGPMVWWALRVGRRARA
jgi:uncharacterized membrane protein